MKTLAAILVLSIAAALFAEAGSIQGQIRAKKPDAPEGSGNGAYTSRKFRFFEQVNYETMDDFVVYIEGPVEGASAPLEKEKKKTVTQQDAKFTPRILPIMVGTTVEWPNRDSIFHNAFSFSDPKPFDLGLYKEESKTIAFDRPGRVDVFCSIHKNMHCIILILENPFFARSGSDGKYAIEDVPAGTYRLKAWHERLPPQEREVTVLDEGSVTVDFTMGITGLPRY